MSESDDIFKGILLFGTVGLLLKQISSSKMSSNADLVPGFSAANGESVASETFHLPHNHEAKMMSQRLSKNDLLEGVDEDQEKNKVVVKVPATTANLGPGYDTIGMAVDMWSEYTIERADKFEVICIGEGSYDMPLDDTNLVCFAVKNAFKKAGKKMPLLKYTLVNRIPYARGLGSSSAAIVGGLIGGLVLAGHRVPGKSKSKSGPEVLMMTDQDQDQDQECVYVVFVCTRY